MMLKFANHRRGLILIPRFVSERLPVLEIDENTLALGYSDYSDEVIEKETGLKVAARIKVSAFRWLYWDFMSAGTFDKISRELYRIKVEMIKKQKGEDEQQD